MSDLPRVALAVEGPTDLPIILAALDAMLGEIVPSFLQPPGDSIETTTIGGDAGEHGGGWKGVRSWCQSARSSGQWANALARHGMVIIHVDADIAGDDEIKVECACPPPVDTVNALRPVVAGWIGQPVEEKCVLCVPSKASDAWLTSGASAQTTRCVLSTSPTTTARSVSFTVLRAMGASSSPSRHASGRTYSSTAHSWSPP